MPLYLTEADVGALFEPADALPIVEESFHRLAAGEVVNEPRLRLPFDGGALALMAAVDRGLGVAGIKTYVRDFVVVLFEIGTGECIGVIEADRLGQLRTGAASGVAAHGDPFRLVRPWSPKFVSRRPERVLPPEVSGRHG